MLLFRDKDLRFPLARQRSLSLPLVSGLIDDLLLRVLRSSTLCREAGGRSAEEPEEYEAAEDEKLLWRLRVASLRKGGFDVVR